ncbi:MAG: hypothetical protein H0U68_23570 [Ramlibacter sp.]|nr:hypothetical protein [Ramlibacter sp.]
MPWTRAAVLAAAMLAVLGGCKRAGDTAQEEESTGGTSVLGNYGWPRPSTQGPLSAPPAPPKAKVRMAPVAPHTTLAVWADQGRVYAARHSPVRGWDAAQALDPIYGQASAPRLVSNGQGSALVVWRHTVGHIDSLRYSHFDVRTGWSEADVVPGALPRAPASGQDAEATAPHLQMDGAGNVRAEWPSGFSQQQLQVSTFLPGEGWARPLDVPLASAEPLAAAPARAR